MELLKKRYLARTIAAILLLAAVALASVKIIGGTSGTDADVDTTPKALRTIAYDARGTYRGTKITYRASTATSFTVASSTSPFFIIQGSATKTVRVQRIYITGLTIASVAYAIVEVGKYSTAITVGTPVTMTIVPLDSGSAAGTANLVQVYTAAPTAGNLVGIIDTWRTEVQSTTAAAAGIPTDHWFDFRTTGPGENESLVLRGTAEGVGLNFDAAAANIVGGIVVEWTEE